jgi:hypothetical protein
MIRWGAVAVLALVGCGPMYKFVRNSEGAPEPRPADCDFRVTGSLDAAGYAEVGILQYGGGQITNDLAKFKMDVRPSVCAAGGDLVVTEVNGYGHIVRGIVFKKVDETARR